MKFLEVEFKYRADDIPLSKFMGFCMGLGKHKYVMASGWDHFYDSPGVQGFARHRIGPDFNQLTYKKKINGNNNFIRHEDNLDLLQTVSIDQIASFLSKFGYSLNKSIFKNCFIYKFPLYTMVYYVIYSESLKEIGRFIEIEMSEDFDWNSEENAWDNLIEIERIAKEPLGISPQSRMKLSLYELVCE